MTDVTNRKLDVDNSDEDRISRDDPLFELSQIIGYSERKGAADTDLRADDGQMDLEDALLRELEDFSGAPDDDLSQSFAQSGAITPEESPVPASEEVSATAAESDYEIPETYETETAALTPADAPEDNAPDTLEAELIGLLGGLGEAAGAEWPQKAEAPVGGDDRETSPRVPAEPPVWYEQEDREDASDAQPVQSDDAEILDAFESALSEGFALSFEEETSGAEQPPADEFDHSMEFSLDLDEVEEAGTEYEVDTNFAIDHVESTYLNEVEAAADEIAAEAHPDVPPALDTTDLSTSDIEAMQPLDLPDLPVVEDQGSAAVDIERELDAALSGYDNYDTIRQESEPDLQAAAAAAGVADARLDFDMGAFEDDLARDLEYVGHDIVSREGEATGDGENDGAVVDNPRPKRGLMIAAAVGGIAILGTIAAFGLTSGDGGETGAPVLVKADSEPAKIVPDDPGGKEVPNQDRAVYGEVDGNGENAPTQETLVSTSEEPIDLGGTSVPPLPSSMTETAKVEDRLTPDTADQAVPAAEESGTAGLAPRRVRTVIVKPDGTLIENVEEPLAPAPAMSSASAPAPAANSPTETEESVRRIDMAANAPQASEPVPDRVPEASESAQNQAPDAEQTETATAEQLAALAEPEAVEEETTEDTQETAVVRQSLRAPSSIPERPADQPVTIVGSDQASARQTAAVAPQAAAPEVSPPASQPPQQQAVPAGAYTVQIASQPSAELAQRSAADLERRYADIIGGRSVAIQQAEIEGRGVYHRVRIVANNRQDAVAVCERIKQEGGSCFVAR